MNESSLASEAELRGFSIKIIVKSLFLNKSIEKEEGKKKRCYRKEERMNLCGTGIER